MKCTTIRLPDGSGVIVCGARQPRAARCQWAGCLRPHAALCDFPIGNGRTCDAKICEAHRLRIGPNEDRCPQHAEQLLLEL